MSDNEKTTSNEKKIKCTIVRDRWDENCERIPKGTEVYVPAEEAMDGVEAGTLKRVK